MTAIHVALSYRSHVFNVVFFELGCFPGHHAEAFCDVKIKDCLSPKV